MIEVLSPKLDGKNEPFMENDKIALEDHSYSATRKERRRNEKSWKLSLNAEGIQEPLNQRSDFIERRSRHAKDCTMNLQR